jgi:hypothetical protein
MHKTKSERTCSFPALPGPAERTSPNAGCLSVGARYSAFRRPELPTESPVYCHTLALVKYVPTNAHRGTYRSPSSGSPTRKKVHTAILSRFQTRAPAPLLLRPHPQRLHLPIQVTALEPQ